MFDYILMEGGREMFTEKLMNDTRLILEGRLNIVAAANLSSIAHRGRK